MEEGLIKVLLVDDQEDDFLITKHRFRDFEEKNYELAWQNDYDAALQMMIDGEFDIYLLDYRLDFRTGLELMKDAKAQGVEEPMILLTGQGDKEVDHEAMKYGASDYLIKHNMTSSLLERSIRYTLERTNHIKSLRERERQLENLVKFKSFVTEISTQFINLSIDDIDEAVEKAAKKTCEFGNANHCFYFQQSNERLFRMTHHWSDSEVQVGFKKFESFAFKHMPWLAQKLTEREVVNIQTEEDWPADAHLEKSFFQEMAWTSMACIPMVHKGDLVGFICLVTNKEHLTWDEDLSSLIKMVGEIFTHALERKRMEQELIRMKEEALDASKIKSEFLSNMSHELRTPLNSIVGMSDLISSTELNEDQRKYVEVFRKAGNSLAKIINDILDFSSLETNKFALDYVEFNLHDLLKSVTKRLHEQVSDKGLHMSYEVGKGVPVSVSSDSNRLTQILMHILGNAVKFTLKGDIHLQVKPYESDDVDTLLFSISDTGIGIPGSKIDEIFGGFVQGDSSLTRRFGGTGLGLTISKRIIELMEGKIWVESKEGQGSTFYFTIKMGAIDRVSNDALDEEVLASEEKKYRVLLVDDAPEMLKILDAYLKMMNYEVVTAENGQDAITKYRTGDFDIIFMDMRMPVKDGIQATKEIREYEKEKGLLEVPIIALTSYSMKDEVERSLSSGCNEHLVKPVTKKPMMAVLEKYGLGPEDNFSPAQKEVSVHIDPDLKALIPGYLKKRSLDEESIRQAIGKLDFNTIREIAHKMKGSGGGYGFHEISEIGANLENACRNENVQAIEDWCQKLNTYLDSVNVKYT